jgi:hypothetical protein
VLPLDAFDAHLSVPYDVCATSHNERATGRERLERRVELDAPVRSDVRRGRD